MCAVGRGRACEAHLCEVVDLSDGGDVVGDEGAHLGLELDVVRLVPRHVLEELLDLAAHLTRAEGWCERGEVRGGEGRPLDVR